MKNKTLRVSLKANNRIFSIADYIEHEIKMPETAYRYAEKLISFGQTLIDFPLKYPICKNEKLSKRNLRCAVFDKKWIFAYKVTENYVIIKDIIWGGSLVWFSKFQETFAKIYHVIQSSIRSTFTNSLNFDVYDLCDKHD